MQLVVTVYRRDAEGCEIAGDAELTDRQVRDLEDALANCANDWIEQKALDRAGGVAARCFPEEKTERRYPVFTKEEAADIAAVLRDRASICRASDRKDRGAYYDSLADRLLVPAERRGNGECEGDRDGA
jgi:hypothetical protein